MAGRRDSHGGRRRGRSSCRAPAGGCRCGGSLRYILDALRRCDPPGEDEDRLAELVQGGGNGSLARWYYYLECLSRRGPPLPLCPGGWNAAGPRWWRFRPPSWRAVPAGRRPPLRPLPVRLSAPGGERGRPGVAPGPRPGHPRRLPGGGPRRCPGGAGHGGGTGGTGWRDPADAVAGVLALLLRAGMLGEAGPRNLYRGRRPGLQTWEFHDLLFHARSRRGRFDAPYGGTYRLAGRLRPAARPETGHGGRDAGTVSPRPGPAGAATTRPWLAFRSSGARSASSMRRARSPTGSWASSCSASPG